MNPKAAGFAHPSHQQTYSTSTSNDVARPPRYNAVKHGLYSLAILIPGEDADEYVRLRLALFHTYRPQTEDEAECVQVMAECRWFRRRYVPVQAQFDTQVLELAADAAGRLCEPVGHQRVHSSIDATKHRQRVDRELCRARSRLFELQKFRRLGLVEGAVKLADRCYMEVSGAVVGPVASPVIAPTAESEPEAIGTSASDHGRNGKNKERKETGRPQAAPDPAGLSRTEVDCGAPLPQGPTSPGEAFPPRWTPAFAPLCVSSVAPSSMLKHRNHPPQ